MSPLHYLSVKAHRAAWTVIDAAFIAGLLIAIRLLMRHTAAAAVLGTLLLGFMGARWGFMSGSGAPDWMIIAYSIGCCTAIVLLYTRVGILAGVIATFVLHPYDLITTDFDAWFAPYGVADVAILLALTAYGFWVSLAGRPIFKDMLAEP